MNRVLGLVRLVLSVLILPVISWAQGVGVGTTTPSPSAALEIKSTTQGLLLPRMTALQRAAIVNPAGGLLVFQTDATPGVYYYSGSAWMLLTGTAASTPTSPVNNGVVTTLAGNTFGYAEGTGTSALFRYPAGVAVDNSGTLYVADYQNTMIRRVATATATVTTLAGSSYGFADGSASTAQFGGPTGVAFDGNGNLYVADPNNQRIRKVVIATGAVSTLAGNGTAGNVDGIGTAAQFTYPIGVAADGAGNLYVTDQGSHYIRKIVLATRAVTTLAGSGTRGYADGIGSAALFSSPHGIAADGNGNLYVGDFNNHRIRRIVVATGAVSTIAGTGAVGMVDGAGSSAQFYGPTGVACDAVGNVYIADAYNNRIRKISAATGDVTTLAGSGTAGTADGTGAAAQFNFPNGVAVDANGAVYVSDAQNNRLRAIR